MLEKDTQEQPEHRNLNENKQPAHAWSKQPPFHYRNSKSAQWQDQPARGSSPGRPLPSALTSKWPFLIPLSWLCRRQGCQAAGAGLPFLAVFAPLSWTQSLGRKRVDHSVWPPGKGVGTLEVGWAHAKRIPPLQVALFWCHPPPAPHPSSESPLVSSIMPADVTPHSGHGHALPCSVRDTSSYPLAHAPILLQKGGAQATLPCLLP